MNEGGIHSYATISAHPSRASPLQKVRAGAFEAATAGDRYLCTGHGGAEWIGHLGANLGDWLSCVARGSSPFVHPLLAFLHPLSSRIGAPFSGQLIPSLYH